MEQLTLEDINKWINLPLFHIGETYCWKIGPLDLTISRMENEWLVNHSNDHDKGRWGCDLASSLEDEVVWKRWVASKEEKVIFIEPLFPDRSIIIRPESLVTIPVGREAVSLYTGSVTEPFPIKIQTEK